MTEWVKRMLRLHRTSKENRPPALKMSPESSPKPTTVAESERERGDKLRIKATKQVADFAEIMASFSPQGRGNSE